MTIFQLLLIVVVAIASIAALRTLKGDRSIAIKRLIAILVAVAALLAIVFPGILTWTAHLLGIGRGTDLLLYLFVLASMIFAVSSVRVRARQDAKVTELARAVALMEVRLLEQRNPAEGQQSP